MQGKKIDIEIDNDTTIRLRELLMEFKHHYLNNIDLYEEHPLYQKGFKAGFENAFAILTTFLDMKIDENDDIPF